MPCYKPLIAYNGPCGPTFDRSKAYFRNSEIQLPCGRCIGCRLAKAKEWALRCYHEASMDPENNVFVTLTYHPDHLPKNGSLEHADFQKFIRALRKKTKAKIRYYMCGEYGEGTEENKYVPRPHFHALIFGYKFPDPVFWTERRGNRVYRSKLLESIWTKGHSEIGSVTFASAGYVARYIVKKQNTAEDIQSRYLIVDRETGEVDLKVFEYTRMSLKPGIGRKWYDKNKSDLWPHDYAVTPDGRQMNVPTYYREILKKEDPKLAEKLRRQRVTRATNDPNNTPDRLAVRETCQTIKAKKLKREIQ